MARFVRHANDEQLHKQLPSLANKCKQQDLLQQNVDFVFTTLTQNPGGTVIVIVLTLTAIATAIALPWRGRR